MQSPNVCTKQPVVWMFVFSVVREDHQPKYFKSSQLHPDVCRNLFIRLSLTLSSDFWGLWQVGVGEPSSHSIHISKSSLLSFPSWDTSMDLIISVPWKDGKGGP